MSSEKKRQSLSEAGSRYGLPGKITGAVFDADGTLLDSMEYWLHLGADFLRKKGRTPEEHLEKKLEKMTMTESAVYFSEVYGIPGTTGEIIEEISAMISQAYSAEIQLKKGAKKVLEAFFQAKIPMYIATAGERRLIESALLNNGVLFCFQGILTCTEAGVSKQEAEIYELAAKRMGSIKESTLVFEDACFAAEAAKQAGFLVVGVYDKAEKEQQCLQAVSDRYLKSWEEWQ